MSKFKKLILSILSILGIATATPTMANFTGDVKLACEAVLCLSSGQRPTACNPSLSRYFGISHRKWSSTVRARINFLNLCPSASHDANMKSLVSSIVHGAGRCDTASLNMHLSNWNGWSLDNRVRIVRNKNGHLIIYSSPVISNNLPSYCTQYNNHGYTDLIDVHPKYVGEPDRGGFWTNPQEYESKKAQYDARVAREDAEAAERAKKENNIFSWGHDDTGRE